MWRKLNVTNHINLNSSKSYCRLQWMLAAKISCCGLYYSEFKVTSDWRHCSPTTVSWSGRSGLSIIVLMLWRILLCIVISRGCTAFSRTEPEQKQPSLSGCWTFLSTWLWCCYPNRMMAKEMTFWTTDL